MPNCTLCGTIKSSQDGLKVGEKQWHFTRGVKPRPFPRPAIKDHMDEYKQIAIDEAKD